MWQESSEWMKLGGKPFFCFSVLGCLGRRPGGAEQAGPGAPHTNAAAHRCLAHWLESTELFQVTLWRPPLICGQGGTISLGKAWLGNSDRGVHRGSLTTSLDSR